MAGKLGAMARPLRIEVPGGWYHVTSRGNARQRIFRDDWDRRHLLGLLAEFVERFALGLHAYVLMDNHYHLLLQLSEANLSAAMQWLGVSYTVWFNRRHGCVGHLFQGRFKSILIEEARVREVSRYVHLNPVRVERLGLGKAARRREHRGEGKRPDAALVGERLRRLHQYRWSSYRAYLGVSDGADWLKTETILGMGGREEQPRRYREYVEEAIRVGWPESPWERLEAQVLLGGAAFVARVRGMTRGDRREQPSWKALEQRPGWEEVVRAMEQVRGEAWMAFRDRYGDWGRDLALHVARRYCGIGLKALAGSAGGLDYGSVAAALQRFKRRLATDSILRETCELVKRQLYK
jgi:putative transposase